MGENKNSKLQNILFGSIVWLSLVLGLWNVLKASFGFFKQSLPDSSYIFYGLFALTLLITLFVAKRIIRSN